MFLEVYTQVLGASTLKRCSKCGEYKDADRDHFFAHRGASDGLQPYCKDCSMATTRARRESDPARASAYDKAYAAANRERIAARKAAHYNENRQRVADRDKARYDANPQRSNAINKAWRDANRDHLRDYRKQNRERQAAVGKAWVRDNPDKVRANTQRRRARKRSMVSMFTDIDWQYALDYFGGCCAACGRQPGLWHTLAADHWIPLTSPDCPGTVPWNIVPLCHGVDGCNNQKFNWEPERWLIGKFGKRKGRAIQRRIEAYLDGRKPAGEGLA